MKQPYGKISRGRKQATGPSNDRLVVKIHGRHTIEQLSLELQKALAQLHDLGAEGVEACSIYLKPLDAKAEHIALYDEKGSQISQLEISEPPADPPYRGWH